MPMPRYLIRKAADADARACAMIFHRSWQVAFPKVPRAITVDVFRAETKGEEVFVAEQGEVVLGFVAVHVPGRFIHHLFVEPAFHRGGLGAALLTHAVNHVGGEASLKCGRVNTRALRFYEHLGWRESEEGDDEMGGWVLLLSPPP